MITTKTLLARGLLSCTAAMVAVSCASDRPVERTTPAPAAAFEQEPQAAAQAGPEADAIARIDTREEIVERSTGGFIGAGRVRGAGDSTPGDINLRFDATDIREFVGAVLGDILGVNYLIDSMVAGTVTVQTTRPGFPPAPARRPAPARAGRAPACAPA
jgi:general secretion pathway protein D